MTPVGQEGYVFITKTAHPDWCALPESTITRECNVADKPDRLAWSVAVSLGHGSAGASPDVFGEGASMLSVIHSVARGVGAELTAWRDARVRMRTPKLTPPKLTHRIGQRGLKRGVSTTIALALGLGTTISAVTGASSLEANSPENLTGIVEAADSVLAENGQIGTPGGPWQHGATGLDGGSLEAVVPVPGGTVVDPATLHEYPGENDPSYYSQSSNPGRIWIDKSVFSNETLPGYSHAETKISDYKWLTAQKPNPLAGTQGQPKAIDGSDVRTWGLTGTHDPDAAADTLGPNQLSVGVSVLGTTRHVYGENATPVPTDTVLILDTSSSMTRCAGSETSCMTATGATSYTNSRAYLMAEAVDVALSILADNPANRVGVVTFDTSAGTVRTLAPAGTTTYQRGSATTIPAGTWNTAIQNPNSTSRYLWSRITNTYVNGSSYSYSVSPQDSTIPATPQGMVGKTISQTAVTYRVSLSQNAIPTGTTGTWSAAVPTPTANQYLWTRTAFSYTDGTSSTTYAVGLAADAKPRFAQVTHTSDTQLTLNIMGSGSPKTISSGGASTNTQDGIRLGMRQLVDAAETTWQNPRDSKYYPRVPNVILFSDGEPTYSQRNVAWWNPVDTGTNPRQGPSSPGDNQYYGNGFLAAMTAGYLKKQIASKYENTVSGSTVKTAPAIYTIGFGVNNMTPNGTALALATLNPTGQITGDLAASQCNQRSQTNDSVTNGDPVNMAACFKKALEAYLNLPTSGNLTTTSVAVNGSRTGNVNVPNGFYTLRRAGDTGDTTGNAIDTSIAAFDIESLADIQYNDAYYDPAPNAEALRAVFEAIARQIVEPIDNLPISTDSDLNPDADGTYTDYLGPFMRVSEINRIDYCISTSANKPDDCKISAPFPFRYNEKKTSADGLVDTYTYVGDIKASAVLKDVSVPLSGTKRPDGSWLSKPLTITVTHSPDISVGDIVSVNLPVALIPIRNTDVYEDINGRPYHMKVTASHPMHIFYSIAPKDEVLWALSGHPMGNHVDAQKFAEYLESETDSAGNVKFYANMWQRFDPNQAQVPNTAFVPAIGNDFYRFGEATALYKSKPTITAGEYLTNGLGEKGGVQTAISTFGVSGAELTSAEWANGTYSGPLWYTSISYAQDGNKLIKTAEPHETTVAALLAGTTEKEFVAWHQESRQPDGSISPVEDLNGNAVIRAGLPNYDTGTSRPRWQNLDHLKCATHFDQETNHTNGNAFNLGHEKLKWVSTEMVGLDQAGRSPECPTGHDVTNWNPATSYDATNEQWLGGWTETATYARETHGEMGVSQVQVNLGNNGYLMYAAPAGEPLTVAASNASLELAYTWNLDKVVVEAITESGQLYLIPDRVDATNSDASDWIPVNTIGDGAELAGHLVVQVGDAVYLVPSDQYDAASSTPFDPAQATKLAVANKSKRADADGKASFWYAVTVFAKMDTEALPPELADHWILRGDITVANPNPGAVPVKLLVDRAFGVGGAEVTGATCAYYEKTASGGRQPLLTALDGLQLSAEQIRDLWFIVPGNRAGTNALQITGECHIPTGTVLPNDPATYVHLYWDKYFALTNLDTDSEYDEVTSDPFDIAIINDGENNGTLWQVVVFDDGAGNVISQLGMVNAAETPKSYLYQLTLDHDPDKSATTHPNLAWLTEDPDDPIPPVCQETDPHVDCEEVETKQGHDLTVTATVTGTYDPLDAWTLDKTIVRADGTITNSEQFANDDYEIAANGTGYVDVTYHIAIGHQEEVADKDWELAGTVTVQNPNAWPVPLRGLTVTPTFVGQDAAVCAVADWPIPPAAPPIVGANATRNFSYVCDLDIELEVKPTAYVSVAVEWDAAVADTTASAATGLSAAVTWVANPSWNQVQVWDHYDYPQNPAAGTAQPRLLGQCNWNSTATEAYVCTLLGDLGATASVTHVGADWVYSYTRRIAAPTLPSLSEYHPNVAWLDGPDYPPTAPPTGPDGEPDCADDQVGCADVTVTALLPTPSGSLAGALTHGYTWQVFKELVARTPAQSPYQASVGEKDIPFEYVVSVQASRSPDGTPVGTTWAVTLTNPNKFNVPLRGATLSVDAANRFTFTDQVLGGNRAGSDNTLTIADLDWVGAYPVASDLTATLQWGAATGWTSGNIVKTTLPAATPDASQFSYLTDKFAAAAAGGTWTDGYQAELVTAGGTASPADPSVVSGGTSVWRLNALDFLGAKAANPQLTYTLRFDAPTDPEATATHENIAWLFPPGGDVPDGDDKCVPVSANWPCDDVEVEINTPPLTPTATVTFAGDYAVQYGWDVTKTVSPDNGVQPWTEGGVKFDYTVTATVTKAVTGATASGLVTVENPSSQPLPLSSVSVITGGLANAVVTAPTLGAAGIVELADGSLAIAGSATAQWVVTWAGSAGVPSDALLNGALPNGAWLAVELLGNEVARQPLVFGTPSVTDATATLGDTFPEFAAKFGTVTLDAEQVLADPAKGVFTYSVTLGADGTAPAGTDIPECAGDGSKFAVWQNTATVTWTSGSDDDDAEAKVCQPPVVVPPEPEPATVAGPRVAKRLAGRGWLADDVFEVRLCPEASNPVGAERTASSSLSLDDAGCEVKSLTSAARTGNFAAWKFTKAGTWAFTITETAGDDAQLAYSDATYIWQVSVVQQGKRLVADAKLILAGEAGEAANTAAFTNTYTPPPPPTEYCPIPGFEHLPASDPRCKVTPPPDDFCPIPGYAHLLATDPGCQEPLPPTATGSGSELPLGGTDYAWTIKKSVDKADPQPLVSSAGVEFSYTLIPAVTATPRPTGVQITATVTLTNPNQTELSLDGARLHLGSLDGAGVALTGTLAAGEMLELDVSAVAGAAQGAPIWFTARGAAPVQIGTISQWLVGDPTWAFAAGSEAELTDTLAGFAPAGVKVATCTVVDASHALGFDPVGDCEWVRSAEPVVVSFAPTTGVSATTGTYFLNGDGTYTLTLGVNGIGPDGSSIPACEPDGTQYAKWVNTATITWVTGSDDDDAEVRVCTPPPSEFVPPTISGVLAAEYRVGYDWWLDKALAPGEVAEKQVNNADDTVSFAYVVRVGAVKREGGLTTAPQGTVTLTNPNAVTIDLTDATLTVAGLPISLAGHNDIPPTGTITVPMESLGLMAAPSLPVVLTLADGTSVQHDVLVEVTESAEPFGRDAKLRDIFPAYAEWAANLDESMTIGDLAAQPYLEFTYTVFLGVGQHQNVAVITPNDGGECVAVPDNADANIGDLCDDDVTVVVAPPPPVCDPLVENCDEPPTCDPLVEDCDGPPSCDPLVEDCDGPPTCDPVVEDCDGSPAAEYDAALTLFVEAIIRDGETLWSHAAADELVGANSLGKPIKHTASDADDVAIRPGDVLIYDVRLFNQGKADIRVDRVTFHAPAALAPVASDRSSAGWGAATSAADGNWTLTWVGDPGIEIPAGPANHSESHELHLAAQVTAAALEGADVVTTKLAKTTTGHFTAFAEISALSGRAESIPEVAEPEMDAKEIAENVMDSRTDGDEGVVPTVDEIAVSDDEFDDGPSEVKVEESTSEGEHSSLSGETELDDRDDVQEAADTDADTAPEIVVSDEGVATATFSAFRLEMVPELPPVWQSVKDMDSPMAGANLGIVSVAKSDGYVLAANAAGVEIWNHRTQDNLVTSASDVDNHDGAHTVVVVSEPISTETEEKCLTNPALAKDDPRCDPPKQDKEKCLTNPALAKDDPKCGASVVPDRCPTNPALAKDDPKCGASVVPDRCLTNPALAKDDPKCGVTVVPDRCPTNPALAETDPRCKAIDNTRKPTLPRVPPTPVASVRPTVAPVAATRPNLTLTGAALLPLIAGLGGLVAGALTLGRRRRNR